MSQTEESVSQVADIAVLGCGGWGKNIVRTVHQLGRLRAVVDPSEAGRLTAKGISPDVPIHASPQPVFADPAVKAVMIATPAETHYSAACAAIAAGKDVF